MSISWRVPTRALLASLAFLAPATVGASAASAAIVINEFESNDPSGGPDWVELANTGGAPVDIGGYVLKDSGNNNTITIPAATTIPGGNGLFAINVTGLGSPDTVRLYAAGDLVNTIDSVSYVNHAAATHGRCPDGTGAVTTTQSATKNAPNVCVTTLAWPGGTAIADADVVGTFGPNLSGLAYQRVGGTGVLWAVQNGPSRLFRLVFNGTSWVNDTTNGWSGGKTLVFPDGAGVPDAEGVTLAGGDANGIFVSIERNDFGAEDDTSRPGVLRFDVSGAGTTLTATREWALAADLGTLDANSGLEAVAWVPDTFLTAKTFKDKNGVVYDPAAYPNHGAGLFFVGVEQTGDVIGYALNQTTGAATRVAKISGVFPQVMDLEFDAERERLWVACDDSCSGRTATLRIASSGNFVVDQRYARPVDMPDLNNEGFAIAPQAECVGGRKPVFWSDDSATAGHAVRSGTIDCTAAVVATPTPTPTPGAGPTPTPTPTPTPGAGPTPTPTPVPGGAPTPTPVPGGAPTPTPTPGSTTTVFRPVLSGLPKAVKASKAGTLKLKISCTGVVSGATLPASCDGTVKVSAKLGGKKKTLGTASFALSGGKAKDVSIKLSAAARTALRRGALKATASSTVGNQTASKDLTLSRVR